VAYCKQVKLVAEYNMVAFVAVHNLAKLEVGHSPVIFEAVHKIVLALEVNSYLLVIVNYILINRMVRRSLFVVLQILAARKLVKDSLN